MHRIVAKAAATRIPSKGERGAPLTETLQDQKLVAIIGQKERNQTKSELLLNFLFGKKIGGQKERAHKKKTPEPSAQGTRTKTDRKDKKKGRQRRRGKYVIGWARL